MDKNVQLEVLDWGGSGRPVVLLAGGGNTAHVFDEFAPKLAMSCHVYGITRRGFGSSGFSGPVGIDRLGEDVLAVIESLNLSKPVLVGHSIAGAELSFVATRHPSRVAGLVYLEAGYPYAFVSGDGPTMKDFIEIQGPQQPIPGDSDLVSFSTLQRWNARVDGFRIPEAEFRQTWNSTAEGRVGKQRDFPGSQVLMSMLTNVKRYTEIPAPTQAIFALPHDPEAWITTSADPAVQEGAKTYFKTVDALGEKQAAAFERGVPAARVIRLRGAHYIFLSNEADILREMHTFLTGLK